MNKNHPDIKSLSFKELFFFELNSIIGRTFFKSKIKSNNNLLLLDIGARRNYKEGWVHIDFYNGDIEILHFKFKAEGIAHLKQNHLHASFWDKELLSYDLESVGFINEKKGELGIESSDLRLIKEEEYRREETLVVEGQKPF